MPLFLAIGVDDTPLSKPLREKLRAEHRRYVMIDRSEPIRFSGPLVDEQGDQSGTVYVFEAEHIDDVWSWLRTEPFVASGVYRSMEVRRWELRYNAFDKLPWPQLSSS